MPRKSIEKILRPTLDISFVAGNLDRYNLDCFQTSYLPEDLSDVKQQLINVFMEHLDIRDTDYQLTSHWNVSELIVLASSN